MSADNVTPTPAATTPTAGATPVAGAVNPAAPITPAVPAAVPTVEELNTRLTESERLRKQSDDNYAQLRTLQGRQATELASTRQRLAAAQPPAAGQPANADGTPAPAQPNPVASGKTPQELLREASIDFKLDNPDWKDYWTNMTDILDDPVKVQEAVVYTQEGAVDFPRSLQKAKDTIVSQKLAEAQAEGKVIKAEASTNRTNAKRDAVISGSGAAVAPTVVDMETLRNDPDALRALMVQQGLLDPSDPPSFTRAGAKTKK